MREPSSSWLSPLGRERLDDEPARHLGIDAIRRHARSGILEDARRIAPADVLLVRVLELDAQGSSEHREVVLHDDRTLRLEAAELPVTPVIDAPQGRGTGLA